MEFDFEQKHMFPILKRVVFNTKAIRLSEIFTPTWRYKLFRLELTRSSDSSKGLG